MNKLDIDDINLVAMNIAKELEMISEKIHENIDNSFDTNDQRFAYHLGVSNTIGLLKQLLNNEDKDTLIFYRPDIEISEEMSIEEIVEYIQKLKEE